MSYHQSNMNNYYYGYYPQHQQQHYQQQPYDYTSASYRYINGSYQPYATSVVYNQGYYEPSFEVIEQESKQNVSSTKKNNKNKPSLYVPKTKPINKSINSQFKPVQVNSKKPTLNKSYRPIYSPENLKQYVNMMSTNTNSESNLPESPAVILLPATTTIIQSTLISSSVNIPIESINATNTNYKSEIERNIQNSTIPIEFEHEDSIPPELLELGIKGIWINKSESDNWTPGKVPLSQYKLQIDPQPRIVKLNYPKCIERIEAKAVKFLRPPTPPPPGDIVITQLPDYQPPEAPPIIIRQLAEDHCDPKPKIIRERPPTPPEVLESKNIYLPGKILDPPPRRVIIEKLAKQPDEIQGITVERWLPYEEQKRRVIFNDAQPVQPINVEKNIEYVWEPPCVEKRVEFQNHGVETVDPVAYLEKHNGSLIKSKAQIPEYALNVDLPAGVDLSKNGGHTLVGDIDALSKIDLEREGLSRYNSYFTK
jgi:hypothetical protein